MPLLFLECLASLVVNLSVVSWYKWSSLYLLHDGVSRNLSPFFIKLRSWVLSIKSKLVIWFWWQTPYLCSQSKCWYYLFIQSFYRSMTFAYMLGKPHMERLIKTNKQTNKLKVVKVEWKCVILITANFVASDLLCIFCRYLSVVFSVGHVYLSIWYCLPRLGQIVGGIRHSRVHTCVKVMGLFCSKSNLS